MADLLGGGSTEQQTPTTSTIIKAPTNHGTAITRVLERLDEENWNTWRDSIKRILRLCGVDAYAYGKIKRPDSGESAEAWDHNDNYAQVLITQNISPSQMVHVGQLTTATAIWQSLETVHESKGHQTIIAIIRNLFHTLANEETNITEHLNRLKTYWERINAIDDEDFKISDALFKVLISTSLPLSWDVFTESCVGGRKGLNANDPKKCMSSQEFIGILKEEYQRRQGRAKKAESTNQSMDVDVNLSKTFKTPLVNRIATSSRNDPYMQCKHCG
jgi:hypothetical protein